MIRRKVILKSIVMIAIAVVASTAALADTYDWRDVGGLDYMTPVQNQGPVGTCWAFAAVGALEAKFDIGWNNPDLNLNLSEQHLICDDSYSYFYGGYNYYLGGITGGYEFAACAYFVDNGITDEATLPYTYLDTSTLWPLTNPDLYGVTANTNFIASNTANLKANLIANGPLVQFMDAATDWYDPVTTPGGSNLDFGMTDYYAAKYEETGQSWHAVVLAGFVDDPDAAGGGYWIVKNSWGTGWGDSGYGYITYATTESRDRTHVLTGTPVFVPVPGAVLLGILGLSVVGIKLRKFA